MPFQHRRERARGPPTHHFFELFVGGSDRHPRAPARSDPMCKRAFDRLSPDALNGGGGSAAGPIAAPKEIGRASCRERVWQYVEISVVAGHLKEKIIGATTN